MSNSALWAMTVNGLPAGQTSSSHWCKRSIAASAVGLPRSMPSLMPVRSVMNSGNGRCGSTNCSNLGLAFSLPGVTSNAPISMIVAPSSGWSPVVSVSSITYVSSGLSSGSMRRGLFRLM